MEAARTGLASIRLQVGTVTRQPDKQAAGTILSQTPAGGTSVEEGTEVDFVVAEPKPSGGGKPDGKTGGNSPPSRSGSGGKSDK